MKKLSLIIFSLVATSSLALAAPAEPPRFKDPIQKVLQAYNKDDLTDLFKRFTSKLAHDLPSETLHENMVKLKAFYGDATKCEFVSLDKGVATYRLTCTKRPLEIKIGVEENGQISGFSLAAARRQVSYPILKRNVTKMSLPFQGQWFCIWGGDALEQNYHNKSRGMKYALDFVIQGPDGRTHKGEGKALEDYYTYGKEILAPCDAEVIDVVDGIRDIQPGESDPFYPPGNSIKLRTANKEILFFTHFKWHTIAVKVGQQVQKGQVLGLIGNSGNCPEPHLHFHIQNTDDSVNATGAKPFFEKVILVKPEKVEEIKTDYSPVRGDTVKP